jgi:hypothetical protein
MFSLAVSIRVIDAGCGFAATFRSDEHVIFATYGDAAHGLELLSNLVFEVFGSYGDLAGVCGFDSVFECDAGDDFGQVIKAA